MKNTKPAFFAALAALALLFAAGCSSDDNSDSSLSSSLVGTWVYTQVERDNGFYDIFTYVFASDGTYTVTNEWGYENDFSTDTYEGTWSLSGSTLTLITTTSYTDNDEGYSYTSTTTTTYSVSISGDTLTLTLIAESVSASVSYTNGEEETWTPLAYGSERENSMKEGDSITLTKVL